MTQPQTLIQLSRLRLLLWVGCGLLAGCGFGKQDQAVNSLDLGALPVQVAVSASPPSKAYALAVPSGLSIGVVQTTDVVWRVGENGMPQAYATFRWVSPPAALVRQRLMDRLSRQGPVLPNGLGDETPVLRMNLQQFEQVFQSDGQSVGVLTLQVVLTRGDKVLSSEVIQERVTAQSADAVGGAQALSVASNQAAERVAVWVTQTITSPSKSSTQPRL